jgi:hypothetical protein
MLIYLESLYVKENWFLLVPIVFRKHSPSQNVSLAIETTKGNDQKMETSARGQTNTVP